MTVRAPPLRGTVTDRAASHFETQTTSLELLSGCAGRARLMMRMMRYAENDCNLENLRYPRGSQALAPTRKQYFDYDGYEKSNPDEQDADMDDMADPEEWVADEFYRMAADAAASRGHMA